MQSTNFEEQALVLMSEVPLIDGHNDFPYIVRGWHLNALDRPMFDLRQLPAAHTDIDRLRQGRIGAQIWSAYVPSPAANKDNIFSTSEHYSALVETLQQVDLIHHMIDLYPSDLAFAASTDEVWAGFRSGKVASLIGIEGLHQIANSASVLRALYRLGVRYATLTHSQNNVFADSATAKHVHHGGLSIRGVAMVQEMNRLGMIIDISHTSVDVQRQVLLQSRAPVIYSHSSCSAIVPSPRNTSDECLELLRRNGGVIMISFIPALTHKISAEADTSHVVDHILHVGNLIGFEHVGIGSDFDGIMNMARGLENVSKFPLLTAELLRRGLSTDVVKGIIGLNFLRVFREVETFSKIHGGQIKPMCDEIDEIFDADLKAEMIKNRVQTDVSHT